MNIITVNSEIDLDNIRKWVRWNSSLILEMTTKRQDLLHALSTSSKKDFVFKMREQPFFTFLKKKLFWFIQDHIIAPMIRCTKGNISEGDYFKQNSRNNPE